MFLFYIIIFYVGACLGSFLNVLVVRTQRDEDFVVKPSHCEKCSYRLKWYDNLPIISYLFLRGKCRKCQQKIDVWHLAMEIATGVVVLIWWLLMAQSLLTHFSPFALVCAIFTLFVILLMLVVVESDLRFFIIPNFAIIGFLGGTLLYFLIKINMGLATGWELLIGVVVAFIMAIIFYLIDLLSLQIFKKPGMGMGDVKLIFALTLLLAAQGGDLGKKTIIMFFSALFSAIIIGLFQLIPDLVKKKKKLHYLPFGPFLVLGAVVGLLSIIVS